MTYNATNSTHVEFELSGKGDWIAVGFSDDQLMVGCNVSRIQFYIMFFCFPSSQCTSGDVSHTYILNKKKSITLKFNNGQLTRNITFKHRPFYSYDWKRGWS